MTIHRQRKLFTVAGAALMSTSLYAPASMAAHVTCTATSPIFVGALAYTESKACTTAATGNYSNTYSTYCFAPGQAMEICIASTPVAGTTATATTAATTTATTTAAATATTAATTTTTTTPATTTTATTTTTAATTTATNVVTRVASPITGASKIAWGVDVGIKKDTTDADLTAIFREMNYRGLTRARVDVNLAADTDPYEVAMINKAITVAKSYGVTLKPILHVPFDWGDRTDMGKYPKGDAAALYSQAYTRSYNFINQFKFVLSDWEFGNEINLRNVVNGSPLYGKGFTAAEWNTPVMNDWAQILKGYNDAIDKINKDNNLHLRKVLNTTSTMFGFLDFMKSKGVNYDVISYHYYENLGTNPHQYWGYFDLFTTLAKYNKPVIVNEINAAEIYNAAYKNVAGDKLTEQGYKSFNNELNYFASQTSVKIEEIDAYELYDEPAKTGPEGRFGMLFKAGSAKVSLWILSQYAGGSLSTNERKELSNRGFPAIQK